MINVKNSKTINIINKMNKMQQFRNYSNVNAIYLLIISIFLVLTIYALFNCVFIIDVSEVGVIKRFGAYHRTVESGLNFKIPFGIETVIKVPAKKILQEEFGFRTINTSSGKKYYEKGKFINESLMLTGDLNVADVEWVVQYKIIDAWKYLFNVKDVKKNIRDISMSVMRRVVGDRLVSDVLTTGRIEIANQAHVITQNILDLYDMGIKIERVILQDVNPPESVKSAFNLVNAAKQEQETIINEAEKEYNKKIPEARGKAQQIISEAEAYAIKIQNQAKGDADRIKAFLAEYRKAPEITKKRLYLETIENIFSKIQTYTIVSKELKSLFPITTQLQGQEKIRETYEK